MADILVVDDNPKSLQALVKAAQLPGVKVATASTAKEATERIERFSCGVVVTDLEMETSDAGLAVLRAAKEKDVYTQVILITSYPTPEASVESMRLGAFDFMNRNTPNTDVMELLRTKIGLALEFRDAKLKGIQTRTKRSHSNISLEEELKREVRETAWEKSAVLGLPRLDGDWPDVFVLMPYTERLRLVYEDVLKRVVQSLGLRISRADDIVGIGPIMKDVWSAIHAARIVIADCTDNRPNVFYEIGLAHAIGKQTILISQSVTDVPFNLHQLRIIPYEYSPRGVEQLERKLTEAIGALLRSHH